MPKGSVRTGTWHVELTCHQVDFKYLAPNKGDEVTCGVCGLAAVVEDVSAATWQKRDYLKCR